LRTALLTTAAGLTLAAIPGAYLVRALITRDEAPLSPGAASPGHAHMQGACAECHTGDRAEVQPSCVRCHGAGLAAENDSHAASRFDDPSRAGDLARLDATRCVTCHLEHRPHLTDSQSVTVPADFCVVCHQDVLTTRPTHAGLDPKGCAAAGCHRYHDNRSLYTELLRHHLNDPDLLPDPRVVARQAPVAAAAAAPAHADLATVLTGVPAADAPATQVAAREWQGSAHARAGVLCAGCHAPRPGDPWEPKPAIEVCARCHAPERASFSSGKHGMRTALGLSALRTDDARLPMRDDARGRSLGCTSCHRDHAFSLTEAAVGACEGCHADGHTQAYRRSPHFAAWKRELGGEGPAGSGVSCATCHLPRNAIKDHPLDVQTDHDQNRTLRPRDKMASAVCGHCHGLPFSLAALADDQLVRDNFDRAPGKVRTGFDFVRTGNAVDIKRRAP
jgi:hypothetical protein